MRKTMRLFFVVGVLGAVSAFAAPTPAQCRDEGCPVVVCGDCVPEANLQCSYASTECAENGCEFKWIAD